MQGKWEMVASRRALVPASSFSADFRGLEFRNIFIHLLTKFAPYLLEKICTFLMVLVTTLYLELKLFVYISYLFSRSWSEGNKTRKSLASFQKL